MFEYGLIPKGDVLRVKVSVYQAEQERIRAEGELDVSLAELESAVGTDLSEVDVRSEAQTDEIEKITPPQYEIPADFVNKALTGRPEAVAYEFYSRRAEQLIREAKGERLPTVTLSAGTSVAGNNHYTADDDWYVQLSLQWTLYDGGDRRARIEKLRASARELLHSVTELKSRIRREVIQAKVRLDSACERYEVAKSQVEDAKEDYRLALRRYEARVGTNLDVLDSRSALIQSLTAYVNSVYDIAAARSEMILALGEDEAEEAD
jgi:outer membrane protein TolC